MDLMSGIAAQSVSMKAAQLGQQYSISMLKKTMDTEEMVAKEILDMLPEPSKGQYVDIRV